MLVKTRSVFGKEEAGSGSGKWEVGSSL